MKRNHPSPLRHGAATTATSGAPTAPLEAAAGAPRPQTRFLDGSNRSGTICHGDGSVMPPPASTAVVDVLSVRRPISVPASQAVICPWRSAETRYRMTRPSTSVPQRSTSPASNRRPSWRAMAGRLSPSSVARLDGRRGRIATAAMIRRRVGSASSSIPSPIRFGIAVIVAPTPSPAIDRGSIGRSGCVPGGRSRCRRGDSSAWLEPTRFGLCGRTLPARWGAVARYGRRLAGGCRLAVGCRLGVPRGRWFRLGGTISNRALWADRSGEEGCIAPRLGRPRRIQRLAGTRPATTTGDD